MGIKIESLVKIYRVGGESVWALDQVSLQIANGDFVAITGPSGSGKSTLMNIIGCLDKPTSGKYYLDDVETSGLTENHLAAIRNQKIGFVFQSFNLLPQYTALENVALPLLYSQAAGKDQRDKAREVLRLLELTDRMHHRPNQLSGGQKQRVAIARAIVNNPSIILADEPTGSLDSRTGREVLSIFRNLNKAGRTVIIITHDPKIAGEAGRILNIRDGVLEELNHENR